MLDIAVIGSPREPEVKRLTACLEKLKYPPLIIDTSAFPLRYTLTFADGQWRYEDQDLTVIKAVFLRSLHCSELAEKLTENGQQRSAIEILREKDSMLGSLLRWMVSQEKLILNPLSSLLCHYYKLDTIERLHNANIPVPATIATNDPGEVQKFAQSYKHLICKPLAGGAEAIAISANNFSPQFWARLQDAPVMLQERIYGHDIRAYVLDDQVIAAAALLTDHADFRSGQQNFQPTNLTEEETLALIQAAKLMGLTFAGIDFKRGKDGCYFLLDINPAPMFAGFEQITGLEIADYLAKYLVNASERNSSFESYLQFNKHRRANT
jgi:glutathione synthase/RimK-type ligase-like ATP-grasp enzyme